MQNFPSETNGTISRGEKQGGKREVQATHVIGKPHNPVSCIFLMFK